MVRVLFVDSGSQVIIQYSYIFMIGEIVESIMINTDIDWPDDLRCGECASPVGEDGVKIHLVQLVVPQDSELYGWCEDHSPDTVQKERDLKDRVKRGELQDQAQLWEDYD